MLALFASISGAPESRGTAVLWQSRLIKPRCIFHGYQYMLCSAPRATASTENLRIVSDSFWFRLAVLIRVWGLGFKLQSSGRPDSFPMLPLRLPASSRKSNLVVSKRQTDYANKVWSTPVQILSIHPTMVPFSA